MSEKKKFDLKFNILTLGDSEVGKTSLLLRYCDNKFYHGNLPTVGIDFKIKHLIINKINIKLKIWDTAGQERFKNITTQYYKNADGILLVFSLTKLNTFETLTRWIEDIKTNSSIEFELLPILLIGNKCDKKKEREVTKECIDNFIELYKVEYFETSALENINIKESIEHLVEKILKYKNNKLYEENNSVSLSEDSLKADKKLNFCC